MRIVLDTNVLLAAFIACGVCHQLLEHCVRYHHLVSSEFILNEVREKLIDKFNYESEVVDEVLTFLRLRMGVVTPTSLASPICRDSDDDNILAAAVAGNCECIVTGDKDLLVLNPFQGIDIVNPSSFQSVERVE